MRNRHINAARNVWDRAVTLMPRIEQFWFKYVYMEEMVGNLSGARAARIAAPLLERRVRVPRAVVGLPRHPPLEDSAARGVVLDHLLHERVLVPELVDARQDRRRAVPDVARVIHKLVPHLHLRVLEPQALAPVVDVETALEDGPRALELLLGLLPQ